MAAFVVAVVHEPPADPDAMSPYREQIESTLAPYGGRYRVSAGQRIEVMEGEWRPSGGLVIIEFPSYAQAQAWYHSPEYAHCWRCGRPTCDSTSSWPRAWLTVRPCWPTLVPRKESLGRRQAEPFARYVVAGLDFLAGHSVGSVDR